MKKELYDKCRNPLKQAFCALDAETRAALDAAKRHGHLEGLGTDGEWVVLSSYGAYFWNMAYRISDKAAPPPEPQWVDVPVEACRLARHPYYKYLRRGSTDECWDELALAHGYCDFLGITYDSGFVPLQPYNPEHGVPVSVRFKKETK